ncbi:MAG: cob(I)yrinic acid a,c-diamide adenosyltransferase [Bacteroidota bacterium]
MKIYTKTGDKGTTALIGGTRVPKYDSRIEAYGTVDELISYIGLLRDQDIDDKDKAFLIEIQDRLMTCASILATDCENCQDRIPKIIDEDIRLLEKEIDKIETSLPQLRSFVLPGGHQAVSFCHIARNVCRRAERYALKVSDEIDLEQHVLVYLNRLSDYLFVFSRKLTYKFNVEEVPWKPRL